MPRQRLVKQVWGVAGVRPSREGTVEIIAQLIPVRRVRAALDDPWGPVAGSQPAQVGEALLGPLVGDLAHHRRRDVSLAGGRAREVQATRIAWAMRRRLTGVDAQELDALISR